MASTKIDWADKAWNPVTGCSPISEGCAHCYAQRMAKRLAGRCGYPADDPFRVTLHEDKLTEPYTWKKPKRVFAGSMCDLFHEDVLEEWLWEIFATMAEHPRHTFIIITKRPERMCEVLNDLSFWACVEGTCQKRYHERTGEDPSLWLAVHGPLPNVIGMVTVENQKWADIRIPWLLKTELACRGVSLEPMLGEVDLGKYLWKTCSDCGGQMLTGSDGEACLCARYSSRPGYERLRLLDWFIVGGETGPGARPMHPDWVRKVRDDCHAAGVPFFFKQWGEWLPICEDRSGLIDACYRSNKKAHEDQDQDTLDELYGKTCMVERYVMHHDGSLHQPLEPCAFRHGNNPMTIFKVGKKAAGHLLDGREWREIPGVKG